MDVIGDRFLGWIGLKLDYYHVISLVKEISLSYCFGKDDAEPLVPFIIINSAIANGMVHLLTLSGQIVSISHASIICLSEERFWKDY